MLMKYSLLAIAATAASATTLSPRQQGNGASSDLQGDLAKVLRDELSDLPDVCKSTCGSLTDALPACQGDDVQGCLKAFCTKEQRDAMVSCQVCISKELPGEIDPEDEEGLAKLMDAMKAACEQSGNPIKDNSSDSPSGSASTSASPSKTSAASSETSNAAAGGSQIGMGAIMAALGLVAAAI